MYDFRHRVMLISFEYFLFNIQYKTKHERRYTYAVCQPLVESFNSLELIISLRCFISREKKSQVTLQFDYLTFAFYENSFPTDVRAHDVYNNCFSSNACSLH